MALKVRNKGFTFIELIIVIAILAILAAVAVPLFSDLAGEARESADIANLALLNRATAAYAASINAGGDVFAGISGDAQRMQALIGANILSAPLTPKRQGYSFNWDAGEQKWVLSGGSG